MTTEEAVRAAKTPQEAMLALARALDDLAADRAARVDSGWGEWGYPPDDVIDDGSAATIIQHGDTAEVELKPPDPARYSDRLSFAEHVLKLDEALGDDEDWAHAYALGGPMWLYLGNRELVMSYPEFTKQAMIEDVSLDSARDAHEMARDILKHPTEEGPATG